MKINFAILIPLLLLAVLTFGQNRVEPAQTGIDRLDALYQQKKLSDRDYLDSVSNWTRAQWSSGNLLDAIALMRCLQQYKTIAWSTDRFRNYRIRYFFLLATNARMLYRSGEALYFLEKMEEEIEKQTGNKPLYKLAEKCRSYFNYNNYAQIIAAYKQDKGYEILQSYPGKIKSDAIDSTTANCYIDILAYIGVAYAKLGDTLNMDKTIELSDKTGQALLSKLSVHNTSWRFVIKYQADKLYFYRNLYLLKDPEQAIPILRRQLDYILSNTTEPRDWLQSFEQLTYRDLTDAFLYAGQHDSVNYYIGLLNRKQPVPPEIEKNTYLTQSEMMVQKGDYKSALDYFKQTTAIEQHFAFTLMEQTQEIMYAHAESEFNRNELATSEQEKRKRMYWIIAISAAALTAIAGGLLVFRKEKLKFRKRLQSLNRITEIQIAEAEQQATKTEQKRLGQDLHDELSASMAAITHQLGNLIPQTKDENIAQKLSRLNEHTQRVYETVRAKSHLLYQSAADYESDTLDRHIQKIVDSALPDGSFRKEIDIDKPAAHQLDLKQRIELLRIIQEAVGNIVKHARAANEVFVFMYESEGNIALEIGDNGIGLSEKSPKGIGLQSIRERVTNLNGSLEIISQGGTLLKILIPSGQ